jgi:O-antigen biosynthesis protein
VAEPRAGLSPARNRGVSAAAGDIVAFLDDDEEPDTFWLAALARGFARGSGVGCVTGPILPAGLGTAAQQVLWSAAQQAWSNRRWPWQRA